MVEVWGSYARSARFEVMGEVISHGVSDHSFFFGCEEMTVLMAWFFGA